MRERVKRKRDICMQGRKFLARVFGVFGEKVKLKYFYSVFDILGWIWIQKWNLNRRQWYFKEISLSKIYLRNERKYQKCTEECNRLKLKWRIRPRVIREHTLSIDEYIRNMNKVTRTKLKKEILKTARDRFK